ncbi:MAG TPA: hypothetical protein VM842_04365 [Nitrospira sp.]|nr:hypothetical protein [Nitrospira sp.]
MKIKKKPAKSAQPKPPLYLIGYHESPPPLGILKSWYDSQYGGPLTCLERDAGRPVSANHGPWYTFLLLRLPEAEAAQWHPVLSWDHHALGMVSPASAPPSMIVDTILVAARLARGFTLLTQGTAFDMTCQEYLNPSDWNDRPLSVFQTRDHVAVQHTEMDDDSSDWFHTLGLNKFNLDELEVIQARGLPETETIALLKSAADAVLRSGHNHKIGQSLDLPALAQTIRFVKHRTAAPAGRMVSLREITIASS